MGILDNIERGLERAVNTAFARTFKSGVQPVELAAGLKKQLDVQAVIVDRDRVVAPNNFIVRMSEADYERLQKMGPSLERELSKVVTNYAQSQGYQFAGEVDVELQGTRSLNTGVFEIDATNLEGAIGWSATLTVGDQKHTLRSGTTTVGRGSDTDIRLSDNGASRKHLEVYWDGKKAVARDLGSTNGSKVNGQRFREATLAPGTVITVGQTTLTFQLTPARDSGSRASKPNQSFWSAE